MSLLPKSPKARRRLTLIAAIAPVLVLAMGLALWGFRGSISLFYTPSEADAAKPHCERCLLTPPFEAPYALLTPALRPAVQVPLLPEQVSQIPESPLARAQSARAPPHA